MGIKLISSGGLVIGGGEEARAPLHVQRMPRKGNWYRYSGFTGTITAALAANSELFQFRFLSSIKNYALISKVTIDSVAPVAAPTALGPMGFQLMPARAWTAAGSGGTRVTASGNNMKTETPLNTSQVSDIGIATIGALTAGTKTLDTTAQGQVLFGVGTGAATVAAKYSLLDKTDIFNEEMEGGAPLVCANQEGFMVKTSHVGVATLTYVVGFSVVWCEVESY